MKSELLTGSTNGIVLLTADNQKELSLTFYRIQEYYESTNPLLKGRIFSPAEFLAEEIDEFGRIDYFEVWNGFNFPGYVFRDWLSKVANRLTFEETRLVALVYDWILPSEEKYYVIGAVDGDKTTIKHEICHALYYLNDSFRHEARGILSEFNIHHNQECAKLRKTLNEEYVYAEDVLDDEMVAWLATSPKGEITKDLGCDWNVVEDYVKRLRKVLRKYNDFKM